ncbi:MAG TPA: hypothetical protein VM680_05580, partial [Verrucomicrobiae bacterium]|nr:hypothetical protein [Verrucomicrobiae bacterium]
MKTAVPNSASQQLAFSRTDLFTLLTILTVIAIAVAIISAVTRPATLRKECINNLKNVGLAFRIASTDCNDQFPFEQSTNHGGTKEFSSVWQHFQVLSNELSIPRILVCPETKTPSSKSWRYIRDANITYFVGLTAAETLPQSFLSGDTGFLISGQPPATNPVSLTTNSDISFPQSVHRSVG